MAEEEIWAVGAWEESWARPAAACEGGRPRARRIPSRRPSFAPRSGRRALGEMDALSPTTPQTLGKRRSPSASNDPTVEKIKLPARSSLYICRERIKTGDGESSDSGSADPFAHGLAATFSLEPATGAADNRIYEYQALRPVNLILKPEHASPPSEDDMNTHGCDGWRCGNTVCLMPPADDAPLLRLIDDDKRDGLTQASLPDLFLRLQLKAAGAGATRSGGGGSGGGSGSMEEA